MYGYHDMNYKYDLEDLDNDRNTYLPNHNDRGIISFPDMLAPAARPVRIDPGTWSTNPRYVQDYSYSKSRPRSYSFFDDSSFNLAKSRDPRFTDGGNPEIKQKTVKSSKLSILPLQITLHSHELNKHQSNPSKEKCNICARNKDICLKSGNCETKCLHCGEQHKSTDKACQEYKRQQAIKKMMAFDNLSYYEAHQALNKPQYVPHPNDFPNTLKKANDNLINITQRPLNANEKRAPKRQYARATSPLKKKQNSRNPWLARYAQYANSSPNPPDPQKEPKTNMFIAGNDYPAEFDLFKASMNHFQKFSEKINQNLSKLLLTYRFNREILENLNNDLEGAMFLLGDFNAHHQSWGSHRANQNGNKIAEFINDNHLVILNDSTTTRLTKPGNNPSPIDLSIVSAAASPYTNWEKIPDNGPSDHLLYLMYLINKGSEVLKSEASNPGETDNSKPSNDPVYWKVNDWTREYFVKHGFMQNKDCDFEKSKRVFPEKNRFLSKSLYKRILANGDIVNRDYLVYSPSQGSVFCGPCKLFCKTSSQYIDEGFSDWKHGSQRIKEQENSTADLDSFLTFKQRAAEIGTINKQLISQVEEEINYWRTVLHRVVCVIKQLASRGLAFRGDDEVFGSLNNGNFMMCLELIAESSYLSSTVCEELIELMGKSVLDTIFNELKKSKYFSIIIDSTLDATHSDQLSFILRYVNENGLPEERFVGFLKHQGHTGAQLAESVLNFLNVCTERNGSINQYC
ncbi:unnamed protein product [Brassicogethes aeneus]|uniref:Uncharacterized protein n=1 Tax=Brassicogethes aeneus TaxID=1431903 RepID=A0A9P0FL72_BRAAE|nr:unnamed protein product [Brassicogethes aeneus]